MPQVFNRELIRSKLEIDRPWAAYGLADLEPGYSDFATWFSSEEPAICLLYRSFAVPVVLCVGPARHFASLLDEVDVAVGDCRELYAVVRPDVLPVVQKRYRVTDERPMLRMVFNPESCNSVQVANVTPLGADRLEDVQSLYREGPPDFFLPEMLKDGVYYGVYEDGHLVAVAGTHVVAPSVGVAAVGNVYTRKDRRGRGLSTQVTRAVTNRLAEMALPTVVLNVNRANGAAIRVYEKIGYRGYCEYYEVVAQVTSDRALGLEGGTT